MIPRTRMGGWPAVNDRRQFAVYEIRGASLSSEHAGLGGACAGDGQLREPKGEGRMGAWSGEGPNIFKVFTGL